MAILLASTLLMSEMLSVGLLCRYRLVGFKDKPLSHVFLEARYKDKWLALDPVAGSATGKMLKDITSEKLFTL
jgi:hypothetical protein